MRQACRTGRWGHPSSSRSWPSPLRSIESPSLGFCTDALLPHLLEDDLGQLSDLEPEPDAQNWQHTVGKDVVAGLSQREIDRQEVINGEGVRRHLGGAQGTGPAPHRRAFPGGGGSSHWDASAQMPQQ